MKLEGLSEMGTSEAVSEMLTGRYIETFFLAGIGNIQGVS